MKGSLQFGRWMCRGEILQGMRAVGLLHAAKAGGREGVHVNVHAKRHGSGAGDLPCHAGTIRNRAATFSLFCHAMAWHGMAWHGSITRAKGRQVNAFNPHGAWLKPQVLSPATSAELDKDEER